MMAPGAQPQHTGQRLEAIQLLRGIAAIAVMISHITIFSRSTALYLAQDRVPWTIEGGWGVDIFFVISGFIMVYASRTLFGQPGGRAVFAKRRLFRIVPLYWLATFAVLLWYLRVGPVPEFELVLTSFAFIPYGDNYLTTEVVPLVSTGWTLVLELFFYAIFALALAGSAGKTVLRASIALVVLVFVVGRFMDQAGAAAFTWTRPIMLEYIAGMVLALVHQRGITLPAWLRVGMAAVGAAIIFVTLFTHYPGHWQGYGRTLLWGGAGALLVAAAALGPWRVSFGRVPVFLGDISYSLYIWHLPLLIVLRFLWRHFDVPYNLEVFFVVSTVLSLIAATISYYLFERPISRWLNIRFKASLPQKTAP